MSLTDALFLDPHPFEIWFAARTDGAKGSGTLNDPYNGSTAASFDARMNELPGPTLVHLGPGMFETAGYSDGTSGGWQPKAGMRIIGAGMGATTLTLVNANATNAQFFAIGHKLTAGNPTAPNPMDFCEVSDLTIDCNLTAQPGTTVACGAVRLMGNHVKVRRVRVKGWGTKTSAKPCFVVAVITGDRSAGTVEFIDAGIEDCIADLPSSSGTAGPITVFHAGGKEDAATNAEAFGRGPYIRNCFVDCGSLASPLAADIRALSMGWCRGGVVEGNQIHNTMYGGPYQDKASSREVVVRNNLYKNVVRGPYWNLGNLNPASPVSLTLVRDPADSTNKTALATTSVSDHGLQDGDRVRVDLDSGPSQYRGVFVVKGTPPALNQFNYALESDPGSGSVSNPRYQKAFGAGNLLVERNTIELATGTTGQIAIHVNDSNLTQQAPDYAHGEVIVRENKIRYFNGQFDGSWLAYGIEVSGAKNVIVRDNVVECAPLNPLRDSRCGTVKYFNNKTPGGVLIQGYNQIALNKYSELETEAEDALILSLFKCRAR